MDYAQKSSIKIAAKNQNFYDFRMCVFLNPLWEISRNQRDGTCRFEYPHHCYNVFYDENRCKI